MIFRTLQAVLLSAVVWLAAGAALARRIEVRVIHTTDLHGHLLPTRDYDGNENVGGLLRCATRIRELRAERDHVMLVDCGDLYQGTAVSLLTEGRVMTRALDALGYDAWILGNHEFDWGLRKMAARVGESRTPVLAANLGVAPGRDHPMPGVKPYLVKEFEGIRVVLVGLITPGVPSWSLPDQYGDLLFHSSVDTLRRIMPSVRALRPDILLLATHQGLKPDGDDHANEVNAIAQNFPEFDAIIGGHSHKVVEQADVSGVLFTQAGYHGIWLGCLDLSYDTVERKLINKTARVFPIAEPIAFDSELQQMFAKDLAREQKYLSERLGTARDRLTARLDDKGRSPIQALICRSIAASSGADIVLHGVLSEEDLLPGDIRMEDVWRIVPYENRIGTLLLTASEIQAILEENLARRNVIQFMGAYGIDYDLAPPGSGASRVSNLRRSDGSFLHPRKRFKVALNSYTLASGGARFPRLREIVARPESRMEVTKLDTRTAVADYIRKHRRLSAAELLDTSR